MPPKCRRGDSNSSSEERRLKKKRKEEEDKEKTIQRKKEDRDYVTALEAMKTRDEQTYLNSQVKEDQLHAIETAKKDMDVAVNVVFYSMSVKSSEPLQAGVRERASTLDREARDREEKAERILEATAELETKLNKDKIVIQKSIDAWEEKYI